MTEEAKQIIHGEKGTDLEIRIYTDEYKTLIYEEKQRLGKTLEEMDTKDKREIFTVPFKNLRLGGTANSYPKLCLEIKVDLSNIHDWSPVGCILHTDDPSESPTGGIGTEG